MGQPARTPDTRCDILDELEEACVRKAEIRVHFGDGSTRAGLPKDVYTENHEDFLQLENHLPIPVSMITRVEKL